MTTSKLQRRRGGFTLVELLVVIAIIAILAALGANGALGGMKKAKRLTATKTASDLVNATSLYYDEYFRYPVASGGAAGRVETDAGGADNPVAILMGKNEQQNPKNTIFLTVGDAKGRKGGVVWEGQTPRLFDPWGGPYYMEFDDDFDKEIQAPPTDTKQTEPIRGQRCIVYSDGPDRESGSNATNRDNIYSYRTQG